MLIYSGFIHWTWWSSIVMLVYQRVGPDSRFDLTPEKFTSKRMPCLKNGHQQSERFMHVQEEMGAPKNRFWHRHFLGTWPNIWTQTHHIAVKWLEILLWVPAICHGNHGNHGESPHLEEKLDILRESDGRQGALPSLPRQHPALVMST
jgi:hypothetical protein